MALPDPLSFPVKITRIDSSGPDANNKFTFVYYFAKTGGGDTATFTANVVASSSDQYPIGQTLNLIFDIP